MIDWLDKVHVGDCRALLAQMAADGTRAQMCVTSPPYFGLRDYGHDEQIGLESAPSEYVATMVDVFRAVRDVLTDDGTLWLNLGDSYAGSWGAQGRPQGDGEMSGRSVASARQIGAHPRFGSLTGTRGRDEGYKPKDLFGIPWRVAFALQADGWYLRQDIIWHKPNPMPESVTDRCTKSHEYLFLLAKSERYFCDMGAIAEPSVEPRGPGNVNPNRALPGEREGENRNIRWSLHKTGPRETRNRRSVWTVTTKPFAGAHFATFPTDLVQPCILAGSRPGDAVLDPFMGSGTVAQVATGNGRRFIGCELNPEYAAMYSTLRSQQQGMAL